MGDIVKSKVTLLQIENGYGIKSELNVGELDSKIEIASGEFTWNKFYLISKTAFLYKDLKNIVHTWKCTGYQRGNDLPDLKLDLKIDVAVCNYPKVQLGDSTLF